MKENKAGRGDRAEEEGVAVVAMWSGDVSLRM